MNAPSAAAVAARGEQVGERRQHPAPPADQRRHGRDHVGQEVGPADVAGEDCVVGAGRQPPERDAGRDRADHARRAGAQAVAGGHGRGDPALRDDDARARRAGRPARARRRCGAGSPRRRVPGRARARSPRPPGRRDRCAHAPPARGARPRPPRHRPPARPRAPSRSPRGDVARAARAAPSRPGRTSRTRPGRHGHRWERKLCEEPSR